jgi:guanine deaminase
LRGAALTFVDDPFVAGATALRYEPDALVVMSGGSITHCGPAREIQQQLTGDVPTRFTGKDALIMPGFIDCHVHYPQIPILGAGGAQLVEWLNRYTFIAEQRFSREAYARDVAKVFLDECLRAGTTTAAVFCTVHPQSVDAFFQEADARHMRMIAGKVLMDRNAPADLLDTVQRGHDESAQLIRRWHGRGRLSYAITPRFAASSTPEQLRMAGQLWAAHPGTYLQSHVSESRAEVEWISQLYPERQNYLDVYNHHGLLGKRAIYGHGIWLTEPELHRCHLTGTALAHCPTSNLFLGSGLFDLRNALNASRPVRVGLATDLGAGTSFSLLHTMNEACKVAQLTGGVLSGSQAFYLATRGAARALYLEDRIGTLRAGMEADLVVLDLKSTPLIEFRMRSCESLEEALFIQLTLADDRAIESTYIAGELAYQRARCHAH